MKRILLYLIISLICVSVTKVTANQNNSFLDFHPGYIIKSGNDTVFGFININESKYDKCLFKITPRSETITFSPFEITEFRIEGGGYYVASKVKVDDEEKTVFLEFLLYGIVNLYHFQIDKEDHYFIEKDGTMHWLSNKQKIVTEGNKSYLVRSSPYHGILTWLFQDANEVIPDIQKSKYNHSSLIKLTSSYHDLVCDDFDCIDYTKATKVRLFVSPRTGVAGSWFGLAGSSDYLDNYSAVLGLQVRIIHVQMPAGWSLLTGIDYAGPNSFSGIIDVRRGYRGKALYDMAVEYQMLKLPVAFQYIGGKGRIQPIASVGFNNLFLFNRDYRMQRISIYDGEAVPGSTVNDTGFKPYQMGFNAGLGLNYRLDYNRNLYLKIDFEMRMPFKHSMDQIEGQRSYGSILLLGYEFRL